MFAPRILFQDVIDGLELECLVGPSSLAPEFVRLHDPVLLLGGVLGVGQRLGPGVYEGVAEVLGESELVLELSVKLPGEPGLVLAVVRVVLARLVPLIDGILTELPLTDA